MIVNADDLGYESNATDAILWALEHGLVDRATIMANMPDFERAAALARERGLGGRVGIHFVLTEGRPISAAMASTAFVGPDGTFLPWRGRARAAIPTPEAMRAVATELEEQVARCRNHGLDVWHLDSHHHVHNEPVVAVVLPYVAERLGIRSIRIAENVGRTGSEARRAYKRIVNRRLQRKGLAASRFFGSYGEAPTVRAGGAAAFRAFELMTHPLVVDGRVVDRLVSDRMLVDLIAEANA